MSDSQRHLADTQGKPPIVTLTRIRQIPTYEIMEADLQHLEQAMAAEMQAQGFFTLCLGLLLPTLVAWGTTSAPTPQQLSVYISASLVFGIATAWFGVSWWQAHKVRPALIEKIRQDATTVTTQQDL